jgi:hypothetical protein
MEWFCLERISRAYGEPPVQTFLAREHMPEAQRPLAERIKENTFSFFEVVDIVPEKSFTVRDLQSDKELVIREKLATRSIKRGGLLVGRVFPLGDDTWTMSGVIEYRMGADIQGGREKLLKAAKEGRSIRFSQLDMGREKGRASGPVPMAPWDGPELERRLRFALREGRIKATIPALRKRIRVAKAPTGLIEELMIESARKDEEWQFEISQLLAGLWNLTPRSELGNRSPVELGGDRGAGPEELKLMHAFVRRMESSGMLLASSGSPEQMRKLMNEEMASWMETPQDQLGGLSPRQVIEQERRTTAAKEALRSEDGGMS